MYFFYANLNLYVFKNCLLILDLRLIIIVRQLKTSNIIILYR